MLQIKKSVHLLFLLALTVICFDITLPAAAKTVPVKEKQSNTIQKSNLIIVGDSRTVNMSKWVTQSVPTEFVAKSGQGYAWFVNTAIDEVNRIKKPNDSIVIWLGVNDYFNNINNKSSWSAYAEKINELASNEWADCTVYVAAVGYVDRGKHIAYFGTDKRSNVTAINRGNKIKGIYEFNQNLKASLNSSIIWLDTYSVIGIKNSDKITTPDDLWMTRKDGSKDGLHYGKTKTQEIYNFFVKSTSTSTKKTGY